MKVSVSQLLCQLRGRHIRRFALATLMIVAAAGPASAQTVIVFPWDWHIQVAPNIGGPIAPVPGETPVPIWLWGNAAVRFGQPVWVGGDDTAPATFDLGPGGGLGAPIPQPVPMGGIYEIEIELVQMELNSMMPADFPMGQSDVLLRESPTRQSLGKISNLQNNGDGTVSLDSFFDVFFDVALSPPGQPPNMLLTTENATRIGMTFGGSVPALPGSMVMDPLPETDVLWAPTWVWNIFPPGTAPPWVDSSFHPWDWPVEIHGHVTIPEPTTLGLLALSLLAAGLAGTRRRMS